MSVTGDVSDETAVQRLIEQVIERFGKIDILVNNAALYASLPWQKVTEIDVDTWDKVMAVNLRGSFLMVKHAAPHMIARRYGKIINIGSGTAFRGIPVPALRHQQGRDHCVHPSARDLGRHGDAASLRTGPVKRVSGRGHVERNSASCHASASTGGSRTSRHSSRKSPPGRNTATRTTPGQTGNSPLPMHASS